MTRRGAGWIAGAAGLGLAALLAWLLVPREEDHAAGTASDGASAGTKPAAHAAALAGHRGASPSVPTPEETAREKEIREWAERRREIEEENERPRTFTVRDLATGALLPGLELREKRDAKDPTARGQPWVGRSDADGSVTIPTAGRLVGRLAGEDARLFQRGEDATTLWAYRTWKLSGQIRPPPGDEEADVSRVQVHVALSAGYPYRDEGSDAARLRTLYYLSDRRAYGPADGSGSYRITIPWAAGLVLVAHGKGWRPTVVAVPHGEIGLPPDDLDFVMRRAVRIRGHVTTADGTPIDGDSVVCRVATKGEPLVDSGVLGGEAWTPEGEDRSVRTLTQYSGPGGAFWFELPFDGDVTLFVKHEGTVVATENLGWSAGDRVDVAIRVIEK